MPEFFFLDRETKNFKFSNFQKRSVLVANKKLQIFDKIICEIKKVIYAANLQMQFFCKILATELFVFSNELTTKSSSKKQKVCDFSTKEKC